MGWMHILVCVFPVHRGWLLRTGSGLLEFPLRPVPSCPWALQPNAYSRPVEGTKARVWCLERTKRNTCAYLKTDRSTDRGQQMDCKILTVHRRSETPQYPWAPWLGVEEAHCVWSRGPAVLSNRFQMWTDLLPEANTTQQWPNSGMKTQNVLFLHLIFNQTQINITLLLSSKLTPKQLSHLYE